MGGGEQAQQPSQPSTPMASAGDGEGGGGRPLARTPDKSDDNNSARHHSKQPLGGPAAKKKRSVILKQTERRQKRHAKKQGRAKLRKGDIVGSETRKYEMVDLLGSGGFGDVYLMKDPKDSTKQYAMKTEQVDGEKRLLRLKMEMQIMSLFPHAAENHKAHFIPFMDRGITDQFKYIVMGLVGPCLEDIRAKCGPYSKSSAMRISQQTLQGIWDLHELGYIHRDIKPGNFAIGYEKSKQGIIHIFDFGISRKYLNDDKTHRIPRTTVKFLGTPLFASRACHSKAEQGRRDDLEAWLYMSLDIFDDNGIPWLECDEDQLPSYKDRFFKHEFACYKKWPLEFKKIVTYVNSLTHCEQPDYEYMMKVMEEAVVSNKINVKRPFDWAGRYDEKKMFEKVEKEDNSGADVTGEDEEEDEEHKDKNEADKQDGEREKPKDSFKNKKHKDHKEPEKPVEKLPEPEKKPEKDKMDESNRGKKKKENMSIRKIKSAFRRGNHGSKRPGANKS